MVGYVSNNNGFGCMSGVHVKTGCASVNALWVAVHMAFLISPGTENDTSTSLDAACSAQQPLTRQPLRIAAGRRAPIRSTDHLGIVVLGRTSDALGASSLYQCS